MWDVLPLLIYASRGRKSTGEEANLLGATCSRGRRHAERKKQ